MRLRRGLKLNYRFNSAFPLVVQALRGEGVFK
nr:MAG TPA: hypothetical protein [Caudoviricetes sp.]